MQADRDNDSKASLVSGRDLQAYLENFSHSKRFEQAFGLGLDAQVVQEAHLLVLEGLRRSSRDYSKAILQSFDNEKADLDESHQSALEEAIHRLETDLDSKLSQASTLVSNFKNSLNMLLFEIKMTLEKMINRWLKFYTREFWVMVELGINEFDTMDKYVCSVLKAEVETNFSDSSLARELLDQSIETVSRKIGQTIMDHGLALKQMIQSAMGSFGAGIQECTAMTPFIAKYELCRVKSQLATHCADLKRIWFFYLYADRDLLEQFIQGMFENAENNPEIVTDTAAMPLPLKQSDSAEIISETLSPLEQDEKPLAPELLEVQSSQEATTQEEDEIMRFLREHPDIDKARRERMARLYQKLQSREVKDLKYCINEKGKLAELVKFEGESGYFLIRNDENGNKVVSQNVNNGWFHVDKSYISNGTDAAKVFAGRPFSVTLPTTDIGGSLMMSGTGAVGNFLYKLVEGKHSMKEISKTFVKDVGSSATLTVLMTTMPFVALSIASLVGVKAINDLRKNQYIKSSKKVTIITEILARAGTKTALTVGGAVIGQTLIPIPFVGAFIGGIVGGFTASAVESSYDSLVAKRVSLELFCFFCIVKVKKRGKWARERLLKDDTTKFGQELTTFLELIDSVVNKKVKKQDFIDQLVDKKQSDMFELMDEIYASMADKEKGEHIDQVFEQRWKSMILFCFISYYYYLLYNQLDELQAAGKLTEDSKLDAMSRFESLLDTTAIVEWLSPQMTIFGQWRPYERFIIVLDGMIKDCKIVTLFKKIEKPEVPVDDPPMENNK